ncbi:MAG: S-layer homology domain-containing protein [Ruminococcaceae bacterium]|nr:S-layer homology domain-containing protein [Oscillospiraceae bacterium]
MKRFTSLLLCMVLVLSLFCVNAAAAETTCIEARATVVDDGTVTVVVTAKEPTANARLTVGFDSDYLTYTGYETAFAVHSVKAEEEQLTIGLANATANAVPAGGELVKVSFDMTGHWDETAIEITSGSEKLTVVAEGPGYRFEDVTADQWFYEAVEYMASEGYIVGISQTHFGPALDMNRASFVTLLGRLEGIEKVNAETRFTDVPADSFYSGYVKWADEKDIVNGVSETLFAPANSVTREQMVTFLYRYVLSEGVDVTVTDAEAVLNRFPDAASVSDWAVDAFAWAIDRGVINGMDGVLAPQRCSNRAQVAVMLYRFFFEQ